MISSSDYFAGFFTTSSGTIQNLTLSDFSFSVSTEGQTFNAGALVGSNSGTIKNCHIKDAVLSYSFYKNGTGTYNNYIGGLVGSNGGTISDCTVDADMSGKSDMYLGVGYTDYSYGYLYIGGVVGQNSYAVQNTTCTVRYDFSAIAAGYGRWYGGTNQTAYPYAILRMAEPSDGTVEP